jgi:hypothetical protein
MPFLVASMKWATLAAVSDGCCSRGFGRSSSPHRREVIITAPCDVRRSLRGLSWPGVEFIDENGHGPGVRLRNRPQTLVARTSFDNALFGKTN